MTLTPEDIEVIKAIVSKNPDAPVVELVNTQPETPVEKIPEILKSMTPTELKKQFGLNTFEYKFIGIKDFMEKHNITTGSKYSPTLNYANKHLVNRGILKGMNAKQKKSAIAKAIKTLNDKIKNPPKQLYGKPPSDKQLQHIRENLESEIKRWTE